MNRRTRRAAAAVVAIAAATIGTAAVQEPASASSSQCPNGYFCVWTDSPFTGRFAYFAIGSNDLTRPIGGFVFSKKITDVWNRSGKPWCMYSGASYSGSRRWYNNGYKGYTFDFNDQALSLRAVPNPASLQC